MLCYDMLCYVMLCCVVLCYVMLCYGMLCYAMLCYAMLCYAMYVRMFIHNLLSTIIFYLEPTLVKAWDRMCLMPELHPKIVLLQHIP